ncbi:MFS general substrate transporter [Acaromyces ingoldii]|uniref:MFS general substrate transporter n=1 Tax=Acaromyces ingoldii TaxID=215250 RepID=A0A316YE01_9BASI|nr:MFS general substrate transporter [Acaromyces ingoldii]PWN87094.1 MFS general substrate transporter [Acaromyces ingoldii]
MNDLGRPNTSGSYQSDDDKSPYGEGLTSHQQPSIDIDDGFDPAYVKRVIRKVDLRLVPFLAACYSISLIDRTNISLARAAGMGKELKLSIGERYSIAVLAFFIPYILLELPSQVGLRKFGAAIWLSSSVLLWGVVMIAMGFVHNHHQLAGLRALLGVFEATLFPGCAYLISCWYIRRQVQVRLSIFYVTSVAISGLSAILAYGLAQLHGRAGLSGWRWIFIIEGIITAFVGLLGYLIIVDLPDKAKFLSEDAKQLILTRIQRDRSDAQHDALTLKKTARYALDIKLWVFALMFGASTTGSYALSYFLPSILAGMGFDTKFSQILVAFPYIYAIIPAVTTGYLSDKTQIRSIWIVINALLAIMGMALFTFLPRTMVAGRYAGVFLCCGGVNSNVPLVIGWSQVSIRQQSKRAYTSALIVAFGGVGGIVSALVFMEKQAPTYRIGIWFTIAAHIFIIVACAGLSSFFSFRNRKADAGEVVLENHQGFRYQL